MTVTFTTSILQAEGKHATGVEVPAELADALGGAGLRAAFDGLAPSARKEHVRQVNEANAAETRDRRIAKIVETLRPG